MFDYFNMESSEFTDKNMEAQDMMRETPNEVVEAKSKTVELSEDIQQLDSVELRKLASEEYAEHGSSSLRNAYLKLAELKEENKGNHEIAFGSGIYQGKTAEEWLAEEKIADIEHKPYSASVARNNAKKAAENGL